MPAQPEQDAEELGMANGWLDGWYYQTSENSGYVVRCWDGVVIHAVHKGNKQWELEVVKGVCLEFSHEPCFRVRLKKE